MPTGLATEAQLQRLAVCVQDAGSAAWGELDVSRKRLRSSLQMRAKRFGSSTGAAMGVGDWLRVLQRGTAAEVYLAIACESGVEQAWRLLTTSYRIRLVGLASRRGLRRAGAEEIVDDVLSGLAVCPDGGGGSSLLTNYLGIGSLFGWLATMLIRRSADLQRKSARERAGRERSHELASRPMPGPDWRACAEESGDELTAALASAWSRLTTNEKLVLALTFSDGVPQRATARILGVGEPRVSRLVSQALRKIKSQARHLSSVLSEGSVHSGYPGWAVLREAVRSQMAVLAAGLPAHDPSHQREELRDAR